MSGLLILLLHATACPAATPLAGEPGLAAVAKLPAEEAMRRNGQGKQLYRQERWTEARAQYRAALAADPDLLGAALNVACSYSRQARYVEAADEAAKLIRLAYVPWSREVEEAADLGILNAQPSFAKIITARKEAAEIWGRRVRDGVLFVARTKPPLRVIGEGVLALGLNQEIFAWIPETGRYFQVTAEDGHVLAFVASADGRRIAYLLASKLVRTARGAGRLRGLSLRVLDLVTMSLGRPVPLPGDIEKAQLWFPAQPELKVVDAAGVQSTYRLMPGGLEAAPRIAAGANASSVVLTGKGVEPRTLKVKRAKCRFTLSTKLDATGLWHVQVKPGRGKPFLLDTRYGAGLGGMPFASDTQRPRDKQPARRKE